MASLVSTQRLQERLIRTAKLQSIPRRQSWGALRGPRRGAHCKPCAAPPDSDRGAATATTASEGVVLVDGRSISANGVDISSDNSSGPITLGTHMECVSTGMDVMCIMEPDEPGLEKQQQQQPYDAAAAAESTSAAGTAEAAAEPLQQLLSLAFLVAPFFLWGTTMAAMRPVTLHTTPLFMGSLRMLPGGLALVAWAAAKGRPQPATPLAWAWISAFALIDGAMFQGFLSEGLQRTSAGLGSVIIDSQPLTVAVLAALLFDEHLSGAAIAGLFLGVAGLLLLEVPQEAAEQLLSSGPSALLQLASQAPAALADGKIWDSGEWWMLLAAQSMAVGTVMVRWVMRHCDPVMATGWHMVLGGAALLALSLATDQPELSERLQGFGLGDAAAMGYGSLLGGAAAYGIFFYNATRGSLTALSSLTFLTPMFAAGAGYLALGETLTPVQLAGAGVTLGAVYLINTRSTKA